MIDQEKQDAKSSPISLLSSASTAKGKLSPEESLYNKPWPSRPQPLRKREGAWTAWESAIDVLSLLIPIPFFALAATVIAVNGKQISESQFNIFQGWIQGSTTAFPIFFAGIVGRAAIKYATWKLEQGTTLGYLEQLMGSKTVVSAITTQLQLKSYNCMGLCLIIIWSLSPIGAQSILQILEAPTRAETAATNISYFNSRQQSYATPNGPFKNLWFPGFTILFGSSLLSPAAVKTSSMDFWGNPKIPYYSQLSSPQKVADGWTEVSESATTMYSSLFGIPINGIEIGNTTLTIESSYLELSCTNKTVTGMPLDSNGTFLTNTLDISPNGPFVSAVNVSLTAPWAIGYQGPDVRAQRRESNSNYIRPKSCPDCLGDEFLNTTFIPGTLLYQEFSIDQNITSIYCTPSQAYVESKVLCSKSSSSQICRVIAQRPSRLPQMSSEITMLSFSPIAKGLTSLLPNATTIFGTANPIQNYLYSPLSESAIISGDASAFLLLDESPLQQVSLQDFSNRLSQVINSLLFGSMWNSTAYITGGSFKNIVESPIGGNNASYVPATDEDLVALVRNQTSAFTVPALLSINHKIYKCSFPWVSVLLLSTSVLWAGAVVGVVFSRRTSIPEYLGYVSSVARESPWIRMPDVGVNMDGMDKARLCKDVKVRLGDVSDTCSGSSVGRLAFARLEETAIVEKGKLYV